MASFNSFRYPLIALCLMSSANASAFSDRRLIVAFGEPGSAPFLQLADAVEQARCQLIDRDVDVIFIDATELLAVDPGASDSPTVQRALAALPMQATGFELVLIGKDGGVKWRQDDPAALSAMLERIDAMPMRRAEMRRAGGADRDC